MSERSRSGGLAKPFLDALPGERAAFSALPDLEQTLERLVSQARQAWPSVELDGAIFIAELARRVPSGVEPAKALAAAHAADLYLAWACAAGSSRALIAFEERYLPEIRHATASISADPAFLDELQQSFRQKFLTPGTAGPAKIADYSGFGSLKSWLRAVVLRMALRLRRKEKPHARSDNDLLQESAGGDLELDYIKKRYRAEFSAAFKAALEGLSARDRNLLRLHVVEGLNIAEIGVFYRAHRSSVARWIAAARQELLDRTRKSLSERLRIDHSELDSMVDLLKSQIDISIAGFLARGE